MSVTSDFDGDMDHATDNTTDDHMVNEEEQTTIHAAHNITQRQCILLVMAFVIKHQLTGVALKDLV